jgi:membrane-bound lytic murein transglycosylase A
LIGGGRASSSRVHSTAFLLIMISSGLAAAAGPGFPILPEGTRVERLSFGAIDGWTTDDHAAAFSVFLDQCSHLMRSGAPLRAGAPAPPALGLQCRRALSASIDGSAAARLFFEQGFQPLLITPAAGHGFLTGYYEPLVDGALSRSDSFAAPLLARPDDLVTIPQGETWPGIPGGLAAAGRNADGSLFVYPDRAAIEDGALGARAAPIAWLRDRVEVFMMQVQGSGRLRLPDGRLVRIAYSGRNGHPYTSIGRYVAQTYGIPPAELTLEPLKAWLRADAARADAVMRQNRSYVFFRIADELAEDKGPIGGAGTPLTPFRSLAVDRALWAYGLPVWIDGRLPGPDLAEEPFRRLLIAEDTGSAIVGPARGDLFHGTGDSAGRQAGAVRHPVRFVVFWPKAAP